MTQLRTFERWAFQVCILSTIGICAIACSMWLYYGSLQAATMVLAGQPVFPVQPQVGLGVVRPGSKISFDVTLQNASDSIVSILGVDESCQCTVESPLPISIAPHCQRAIQLAFTAKPQVEGVHLLTLPFITSSADCPLIAVELSYRLPAFQPSPPTHACEECASAE